MFEYLKPRNAMTNEITVKNNKKLTIDKRQIDNGVEVTFHINDTRSCWLHWGLTRRIGSKWQLPSNKFWPEGSVAKNESAVQSPFIHNADENQMTISLDNSVIQKFMNFVLYYPEIDRWDNNHGKNYHIKLIENDGASVSLDKIMDEVTGKEDILYRDEYVIDSEYRLFAYVAKEDDTYGVSLITDIQFPLLIHWGIAVKSSYEWRIPPESIRPSDTVAYSDKAVQTRFKFHDGLNKFILYFRKEEAPLGLSFVLRTTDEELWFNNNGHDFYVPISEVEQNKGYHLSHITAQVSREIIQAEMARNSWTLMHRFNLCHDMLDKAAKEEDGLALVYVWMRFSFLRQLDWQRNYNTKPRELSHAQNRLTSKLAQLYSSKPEQRELIRLIMSTLGRGGEGQRIRDEILQIMHRHRIKEVAGSFMEEWHQKLHNNTTPDDIVICDAYLEFLRSNGDIDVFYHTLEASGVTKARLENFERPIVTSPDFIPHLKDALIDDFENYLRLLRSVHSGTDIDSATEAAGYLIDSEMRSPLDFIFHNRYDSSVPVLKLSGSISELRSILNNRLSNEKDEGRVRDMIYLDLALEEYLRTTVERTIHISAERDELLELIVILLENLRFTSDDRELDQCFNHLNEIKSSMREGRDWLIHLHSVLERLGRAIASMGDRYYALLQEKAEYLGIAFRAEQWIIRMFTEEVIRGRSSFILSLVIHHLDPILRKDADLGEWQVISPGAARGTVRVLGSLRSFQDKSFDRPTIVVADKVRGDEEPPEGLVAVITTDSVDLVAHVAIRARNHGLLFATCYNRDVYEHLRSCEGQTLSLSVGTAGDVKIQKVSEEIEYLETGSRIKIHKLAKPGFHDYAISQKEFDDKVVGSKSNNLNSLRGNLPDWIHLPSSAAIPFGVFERVLQLDINKKISSYYFDLQGKIHLDPVKILSDLRRELIEINVPDELETALKTAMDDAGLIWPENSAEVLKCIKRVWASKWNERAYISREKYGIPHEDLYMSVLVQQVINAEYAFVIHTINPFNNDNDELYGEVVIGLGETLVGNYPGRALGFIFSKKSQLLSLLSYPSKSVALKGGGLIFRSDSNGEDLTEYAGAGLYDSVMIEEPQKINLDYVGDHLLWDQEFRNHFLTSISKLGIVIEEIMGSAQDIEGVYENGTFSVVQTRPQV